MLFSFYHFSNGPFQRYLAFCFWFSTSRRFIGAIKVNVKLFFLRGDQNKKEEKSVVIHNLEKLKQMVEIISEKEIDFLLP